MIKKTDAAAIAPYLQDASNFREGSASEVVIPESREELIGFLKESKDPISIAGAGTGLTASRIPLSGTVVSLEKFRRLEMLSPGRLLCGPAVTLKEVQEFLKGSGWFYPPNPTESLASIGGTVATNASGSRSYKWGATRQFVQAVTLILADGRWTRLERGKSIRDPLELNEGKPVIFPETNYISPQCKNAAGYYFEPGMDWLDLFVGSEGTLGIFVELELKLVPAPERFLSGILFFEEEPDCWKFVESARASSEKKISPCALEYFDSHSLNKLKSKFPNIPESARAALFFEQDVATESEYDSYLDSWYGLLEKSPVLLDESWFAENSRDLETFHQFRHQIPLLINEENSREHRVKIGTDMAVGNEHFLSMMTYYQQTLDEGGVPYVVFGHIGDNHLHINLLPPKNQLSQAKAIYNQMVDQILKWGGTVSAEHGIGKLKKEYYHRMVGPSVLGDLRQIKSLFDPDHRLGQGNLV